MEGQQRVSWESLEGASEDPLEDLLIGEGPLPLLLPLPPSPSPWAAGQAFQGWRRLSCLPAQPDSGRSQNPACADSTRSLTTLQIPEPRDCRSPGTRVLAVGVGVGVQGGGSSEGWGQA